MSRDSTTWAVIGAAVQGRAHESLGLPCQDALGYRAGPNEVLLLALADGAGSAECADRGAQAAVDEVLDALSVALAEAIPDTHEEWGELLTGAFEWARLELDFMAAEAGQPLRDFATTLTCVAAAGDLLAVASLGDGVVVAGGEGDLATVTRLQRGEYANETVFLTQEDALSSLQVCILPGPVSRLAVLSDGLSRLALRFPALEPFEPFFNPLFAFLEGTLDAGENGRAVDRLAGFLRSPRVNERTDDDKSLILALRRPAAASEVLETAGAQPEGEEGGEKP